MRKSMIMLLSVILVCTLVLAACSSNNNTNSPQENSGTSNNNQQSNANDQQVQEEESNINPAGVYPIVKEPVTLKVMVINHGTVEDFATNEFTKMLEEKTNVHIEWEEVPAAQSVEKLNITLASGDYPDIIMNFNLNPSQLMLYGDQGIIIPLNDMIEEYGHEIYNLFDQRPDVKDVITAPNGNIYSLPQLSECYHCSMSQKLWINKGWLDALDLEVPTTTEEFYTVLKAFKEDDPNGNGLRDEIPFVGSIPGYRTNVDGHLMNSFVYYHSYEYNNGLMVKDGKLEASFTQPGWKEGLKFYNKLYNEGLLAAESFTQNVQQLRQMTENPDAELVGVAAGAAPSGFAQLASETKRWLNYVAVPPLKGPDGHQVTPYDPMGTFNIGKFVITSSSEHPEVAFRWGEMFYNEDIMLRGRYGPEGEGWRAAEPGEVGINGEQAVLAELLSFGQLHNVHWGHANPDYLPSTIFDGRVVENPDENQPYILYRETNEKYAQHAQDEANLIPPLWFTEEQSSKIVEYETVIHGGGTMTGYVAEMFARFVTGDLDIDSEWDNYLKQLEQMKLPEYIAIFQEAYDASK